MKIILAFSFLVITFAFISSNLKKVQASSYENIKIAELSDLKFNESNPVELGYVDWYRNFDKAQQLAKKENKPMLVFFQEVPGCSTSSGYGKRVLTNPLIIEAIETLFVPVVIYNNHGGHDREILESFGEPSWNNPVVRFVDSERKELTKRLNGDYSKLGLVKSMISALRNDERKVPEYLTILEKELYAKKYGTEKAVFAMHCFWTGEGKIGKIDGVLSTKPGFMGGREVVEVKYNPKKISYESLLNKAKNNKVASHVYATNQNQKKIAENKVGKSSVSNVGYFRPDSEPKYYMSKTKYKYVPMTGLQSALVNSAIGSRKSPDRYLSSRQLELLKFIDSNPQISWQSQIESSDFASAWNSAVEVISTKVSRR